MIEIKKMIDLEESNPIQRESKGTATVELGFFTEMFKQCEELKTLKDNLAKLIAVEEDRMKRLNIENAYKYSFASDAVVFTNELRALIGLKPFDMQKFVDDYKDAKGEQE